MFWAVQSGKIAIWSKQLELIFRNDFFQIGIVERLISVTLRNLLTKNIIETKQFRNYDNIEISKQNKISVYRLNRDYNFLIIENLPFSDLHNNSSWSIENGTSKASCKLVSLNC